MKTNYLKRSLRSIACLLLALVLFAGMAMPAYAADRNQNETANNADTEEYVSETIVIGYTGTDGKKKTVTINRTDDMETIIATLRSCGFDDSTIDDIITENNLDHKYTPEIKTPDPNQLDKFETDTDATIIEKEHISRDWAEIDWSMMSDGYVKVIVNKLAGPNTVVGCSVDWYANNTNHNNRYTLKEGTWEIPLPGGNTEYAIRLDEHYTCCKHNMTDAEKTAYDDDTRRTTLTAKFYAEISVENNRWLISTPSVNYANAANVCAKALEITKSCKTDAEKITAIFNWTAKNIKYDYTRAKEMTNAQAATDTNKDKSVSCLTDEKNGVHLKTPDSNEIGYKDQNQLDLDLIMAKKKGICNHKATLMAGMLRSIGIPCKVVTGTMNDEGHAWVAVNPQTGKLDLKKLGAGKDYEPALPGEDDNLHPTGWIRLDPTNAHVPGKASNDANYHAIEVH